MSKIINKVKVENSLFKQLIIFKIKILINFISNLI